MILKVKEPPITSFSTFANLLSVTICNDNGYKWYCNNYVQLFTDYRFSSNGEIKFREEFFGYTKASTIYSPYCNNPFIDNLFVIDDLLMLINIDDVIDKLKHFIDNGYYIRANLDRHFYDDKQTLGSLHSAFIYGYDNESFLLADFIKSGKYQPAKILFCDFIKSYEQQYDAEKLSRSPFISNPHGIYMFKTKNVDYQYDKAYLKRLIIDYYNEENTMDSPEVIRYYYKSDPLKQELNWGMGVYKDLKYDYKTIFACKDHKKAMCDKLEFLIQNKYIENDELLYSYTKIKEEYGICLNLSIKYSISRNYKDLETIKAKLNICYESEKRCLEKLIQELN